MEDFVTDDPVARDLRRTELAKRLISHEVRTKSISHLTGLSRNRQEILRRRLAVPDEDRRRGSARYSLKVFLADPVEKSEGAALAGLCAIFNVGIGPYEPVAPDSLDTLGLSERLCEIYEAYDACLPGTALKFEALILLRARLSKGDAMELGKCRRCRCLILVNRLKPSQRFCQHCTFASAEPSSDSGPESGFAPSVAT
jgi:hypothetical protein